MDKRKERKPKEMKMASSDESASNEDSFGHETPGAAEGDLETIEQDLALREQGGPEQ